MSGKSNIIVRTFFLFCLSPKVIINCYFWELLGLFVQYFITFAPKVLINLNQLS